MLENAVYMGLRAANESIYYYRTRSGKEVDFITMGSRGESRLVQVAYGIDDDRTKDREVRALREAMKELGNPKSTLVTYSQSGEIETDEGLIKIVPAWRFLIHEETSS